MGVPVSPRPHRHLLLSALVTAIPVVGKLLYPGPSGVSSACVEGLMFSQVLPECGLCLALPCSLPNHQGSVARYTSSDSVHESASLLNFWLLCQLCCCLSQLEPRPSASCSGSSHLFAPEIASVPNKPGEWSAPAALQRRPSCLAGPAGGAAGSGPRLTRGSCP